MDKNDLFKSFESASKSAFSLTSLLGTSSSTATSTSASSHSITTESRKQHAAAHSENSAFDIPKDELMALCMKLNKKMQSLESKCHDLTRHKSRLAEERNFLLEAMSTSFQLDINVPPEQMINKQLIYESLADIKASHEHALRGLQQRNQELEQLVAQQLVAQASVVAAQPSAATPPSSSTDALVNGNAPPPVSHAPVTAGAAAASDTATGSAAPASAAPAVEIDLLDFSSQPIVISPVVPSAAAPGGVPAILSPAPGVLQPSPADTVALTRLQHENEVCYASTYIDVTLLEYILIHMF